MTDIKGNPGKRKPRTNPPTSGQPSAPEWLGNDARAVFSDLVAQLGQSGVAGEIDALALATLAENIVLCRKAQSEMEKSGGEIIRGPNGGQLQNAWLSVFRRAEDKIIDMYKQFGMTPAARQKLDVSPQETDELGEFLK